MKKIYVKPTLREVFVHPQSALAGSATISSVGGNADFNSTVSPGNGEARSREFTDWDDEE